MILLTLAALMLGGIFAGVVIAADGQLMSWSGVNYTKFLWGNRRYDGSMYNFTTIPGEGYGDNGQGTEFELLFQSRPSSKVEVNGRIKSRFNQNQWTNWGGFGGSPGASGIGGDRGEFDPRSNEYIKLRGITVNITPGYSWLTRATIGSSDFGMFDAFTIGKIRYIDRDNGKGIFFNGNIGGNLTYDAARMSLSRLWSGPYYRTHPGGDEADSYALDEEYVAMDAVYGIQLKWRPTRSFNATGIFNYLSDTEIDENDINMDDGRDLVMRQRNQVFGLKLDWSPGAIDIKADGYYSKYETWNHLGSAGYSTYTAYPLGKLDDATYKLNIDWNDIGGSGFSLALEGFNIGSDYVSVMAARRESDVLLTEGSEGTWYYPESDNASWKGTSVLGYGGFIGHAQQVATTNVDNEFTDFNEPMAETVIGWKGFTVVPSWGTGNLDLAGEYSYIDYNTNWQMWGDDTMYSWGSSPYVTSEPDAGFGSFRNAYMPFQEKTTYIYMLKADYLLDVGSGIELHAKWKYIDEEDLRLNDEKYLTDDGVMGHYGSPDEAGQWAEFDSIDDDDKKMTMNMFQLGAGYQLSSELFCDLTWEVYAVDMLDGNTAFQGNRAHRMTGGKHTKNNVILHADYMVGGAEFGMDYQWSFGDWAPNFGDGYNPTVNDDGEVGFVDSWGVFQSLSKREYTHNRMKTYMKVRF